MANADRGIYEPRYDEPDTFDVADDEEEGQGRGPLILILTVIVLLGIAAVVWLGHELGTRERPLGPVTATGEPPVLAAEEGPIGRTPADPGGVPVPHQDKTIYEQISGGAPPPGEQLLPPEETPALPEPQPKPPAVAEIQPQTPPPAPVTPPDERPAGQQAAVPSEAAPEMPPEPAPAAPPPSADVYVVQVGAYESDALAATAWERVKGRNGEALQGLKPSIKQVDLGPKGVWFRLRVGSFTDRDAAASLCARLKANGQDCIVGKS